MPERPSELLLDTSVVVRYLTNDPLEMAERAARVIEGPSPLVISELVVVESAYVLSSIYGVERAAIVDALSALLQRRNVRLLHLPKPLTLAALQQCRSSNRYSFTDVILWAQVRHAASLQMCTMDVRFPSDGITIVRPG